MSRIKYHVTNCFQNMYHFEILQNTTKKKKKIGCESHFLTSDMSNNAIELAVPNVTSPHNCSIHLRELKIIPVKVLT